MVSQGTLQHDVVNRAYKSKILHCRNFQQAQFRNENSNLSFSGQRWWQGWCPLQSCHLWVGRAHLYVGAQAMLLHPNFLGLASTPRKCAPRSKEKNLPFWSSGAENNKLPFSRIYESPWPEKSCSRSISYAAFSLVHVNCDKQGQILVVKVIPKSLKIYPWLKMDISASSLRAVHPPAFTNPFAPDLCTCLSGSKSDFIELGSLSDLQATFLNLK